MEYDQHHNSEEVVLLREKYNGIPSKEFYRDRQRLDNGEPLAYVIGTIPFAHTTIYLDSRPLIPRVESEFWILEALSHIEGLYPNRALSVLDIFAGSGALGVAWLAHRPQDYITFAEREERHFPTLQKNIRQNKLPEKQINYAVSDIWSNISNTFDIILANPPYVPLSRTLPESVTHFEPHEALFAEDNGTACIRDFILDVPQYSTGNTHVYLEHDESQGEYVRNLFTGISRGRAHTHTDQYGKERYTVAHCI